MKYGFPPLSPSVKTNDYLYLILRHFSHWTVGKFANLNNNTKTTGHATPPNAINVYCCSALMNQVDCQICLKNALRSTRLAGNLQNSYLNLNYLVWGPVFIVLLDCLYNGRLQLFHFIYTPPSLRFGSPLLDLPLCISSQKDDPVLLQNCCIETKQAILYSSIIGLSL